MKFDLKAKSTLTVQFLLVLFCCLHGLAAASDADSGFSRPIALAEKLPEGPLKTGLLNCEAADPVRSEFSISHRGAPLGFPEHTREGYLAAAKMGAGVIECDVTFTKDKQLVCRHSQCDLHSSTNILETPLVEKCSVPPDMDSATPFKSVKCCTSDITLQEFKSLEGRMDFANKKATTLEEYVSAVPPHRVEPMLERGTVMSHKESIRLFKSLGVKMVPELKSPAVAMPYLGEFSQQQYAQAIIDEYIAEGVSASDVFLQSFNLDDVRFWLEEAPEFGKQAVWLDGRYRDRSFDIDKPKTWKPSMQELATMGVKNLAPPLWMLLALDDDKALSASNYAKAATQAGINLIAWTVERSGPLEGGGGWYYQTIKPVIKSDSDLLTVMHVMSEQVGVIGIFSDWPATTTYYDNCIRSRSR